MLHRKISKVYALHKPGFPKLSTSIVTLSVTFVPSEQTLVLKTEFLKLR
jgi:hypothetical protein